jgi:hypothetical protein
MSCRHTQACIRFILVALKVGLEAILMVIGISAWQQEAVKSNSDQMMSLHTIELWFIMMMMKSSLHDIIHIRSH